MKRSHRQLGPRLSDRLGSQHTYRLAHFHHLSTGQIASIAHAAQSSFRFTGKHRADEDFFDTRCLNGTRCIFTDFLIDTHQHLAGKGVDDFLESHTSYDPVAQGLNRFSTLYPKR